MKEENKKNMKKIKNIISDETSKENNDFDILFLVDATGSMSSYITAAKEETKNISDELMKLYPEKMFKYGYIFYRDPVDSKSDEHEVIDLTDDVNSFPEKIGKIRAYGGGDIPEDWVGAYKLANEKISWRNGIKVIMHLADAGAHGKLFTLNDKYPEEEAKLITELEKCAEKKIKIFGYVIDDKSQNSFNECSKIYRSKGGSYEILKFQAIPLSINEPPAFMNPMIGMPTPEKNIMMYRMPMNNMHHINKNMNMNMMNNINNNMMYNRNNMNMMNNMNNNMMNNMNMMNNNMMNNMNMAMSAPSPMMNLNQMNINMNFQRNAINSIQSIMDKPK